MTRTTTIADFVCRLRAILADAQAQYLDRGCVHEEPEAIKTIPGGPEVLAQLDGVSCACQHLMEVAEANEDWVLVNLVDDLKASAGNTWSGKEFPQNLPSEAAIRAAL